jgi:hypothetical protein
MCITELCGMARDKREERDSPERHDSKFEVLGSKFRKPRTSNLEPSSVSPVSPESGIGDSSKSVHE